MALVSSSSLWILHQLPDIPTPTTLLELSEFLTGKEIRCRLLFFVVLPIDVIDVKTDELKHSIYTCCHDGECVFPFLLSSLSSHLRTFQTCIHILYINRGQQAQTQKGTSKQTKSTRACACTFCKLQFSGRQQTVGT